jgi:hypothetical protein
VVAAEVAVVAAAVVGEVVVGAVERMHSHVWER